MRNSPTACRQRPLTTPISKPCRRGFEQPVVVSASWFPVLVRFLVLVATTHACSLTPIRSEEQLRNYFKAFGTVTDVYLPRDK